MNEPAEHSNTSRRKLVAGVGALGLGLIAAPVIAQVRDDMPEETFFSIGNDVRVVERLRIEAMLAHDARGVGELTASDFEFITPLGTVQTRDTFVEGIATGLIDNRVLEPVEPIRIRACAHTAVLRYLARSELTVAGTDFALDLWFTALYESRDASWKIVWLQATELPVHP